ncbi:hypothetical protein PHMEG_00028879 [Phytophthora megakarya]|uniref:Uncharacterized protein n=1 Tax=Phytophthora megakarya TaxID=4795 RepID=A0A225V6G3_9STRA|nr:hypothetical protein PHMEG_00028879 [Phytophthora megakarya]
MNTLIRLKGEVQGNMVSSKAITSGACSWLGMFLEAHQRTVGASKLCPWLPEGLHCC